MSLLKPFIKAVIMSLLVAMVLTTIIGGALYTRIEGTEIDLTKLNIEPTPTIIFDKNGDEIAKFKEEKKDVTAYEEIPIEVIQALISTEDRAFYDHAGINVKAIFRAALAIFKAGGDLVQGGSTVTQQLVKQMYLTDEKSIDRKIKEAVIATELESELSKNEIIKNYLNHVYYGNGAYGIRSAIETYYGMTLEEFKLQDKEDRIMMSALLGGIVQLPSANDPYVNPNGAKKRVREVLNNMKEMGYISSYEYTKAVKSDLMILEKANRHNDDQVINNEEITTYALQEAAKELGLNTEQVRFGGYEIYTSFDPESYRMIREQVERNELHPTSESEISVSLVNPKTGEILALTGGRTAPKYTEYNRAYQGKKQPGSSFKPIMVYGPALESGKLTPWSAINNQAGTTFALGYTPRNFDGKGSGKITMIEALRSSQNIAAVSILNTVGIDYATNFVSRLGIPLSDADKYLPIALGGLSEGVNTLQLADAYQGFTNGGHRIKAHMIKRIVDNKGEIVQEVDTELNESNRVMKESTAKYMENMLQNAVIRGTGTNAQIEGELVGGKTGTTDSQNNIWFAGFTSEFVMTVWMGYDQEKALPQTSWVAAKMFGQIGKNIAKLYPDGDRHYKEIEKDEDALKGIAVAIDLDEKNKKVKLSWNKEDETEYAVYKNGKLVKDGVKKGEYKEEKLEVGKAYTYQIVGYNKYTDVETHKSSELEVMIEKKEEPLEAPKFTKSEPTSNSVKLQWSEVEGAEEYVLTRNGTIIYEGLSLTFEDKDLTSEKVYHYEIVAIRSDEKSKVGKVNVTTKKGTERPNLDLEKENEPTNPTPNNPTTPPTNSTPPTNTTPPNNPTPTNPTPTNPTPNNPTTPPTNPSTDGQTTPPSDNNPTTPTNPTETEETEETNEG